MTFKTMDNHTTAASSFGLLENKMNKKILSRLLLSVLFPTLGAVRTGTHVERGYGLLGRGRQESGRKSGAEMHDGEHSHAKRAVWGGRAFQHAGRDYYWDEHPGQCDDQTICAVSIEELRNAKNYKERERRHVFLNETNTNQSTSLQTAMIYPEEDVLELKYSNGSKPQRFAWSCRRDEVCCRRGCCSEDDFSSRKSFWTKFGIVCAIVGVSFGILCGCFWGCWGIYRSMRGVQSSREPAPYGAPLPVYPVHPAYVRHGHPLYSAQPTGHPAEPIDSREQRSQHALPKQKREVRSRESGEKESTINEEQEDH
ncbi:unnamed protein product [Cylicocyclus nassatus]|uniref:CX domain-containing protein n=1 Tax=Cylicocyclus nassatus TaxID=53992 RepID=A0AA36GSU8_CYLNA|nr:unnamed protein product [Cylicocyclus nassatus]